MELNVLKRYGPKLLIGLAVFIAGAGLGWYLKPEAVRVEEKVKVVEVVKEVVVVQEQVRVEVVKVKDTQVVERWHREKTEERKPDGSVLTREVEDRNIDTLVKEKENTVEVKVVEVEKEVVVEREKRVEVKIEPVLPNWHIGVLAGVAPNFQNPVSTPVVVGLEAERRIAGPFWAGLWATAGSPTTHFEVTNPTVGLKLAVEF